MKEPQSYISPRVLKINVGFLVAERAGYSRQTDLDIPQRLRLDEDLTLDYLQGELRLTRTSEGILVQGQLESAISDKCSRCITPTRVDLHLELEELFSNNPQHPTQFMVGDDNILDLAPFLREETFLNLPQKVYCRPDCQGLCPICGNNRNEQTCDCEAQLIDPRWAALAHWQETLSDNIPTEEKDR